MKTKFKQCQELQREILACEKRLNELQVESWSGGLSPEKEQEQTNCFAKIEKNKKLMQDVLLNDEVAEANTSELDAERSKALKFLLGEKKYHKLVKKVIADQIIFTRLANGMYAVNHALGGGDGEDFNPEYHYYGFGAACDLVGTKGLLRDKLFEIVTDYMDADLKTHPRERKNYKEEAEAMYREFIECIKDYVQSKPEDTQPTNPQAA